MFVDTARRSSHTPEVGSSCWDGSGVPAETLLLVPIVGPCTLAHLTPPTPHHPMSHLSFFFLSSLQSPEQELEMMIYNWQPYFTLKDSVMDPSYDGPDM